MVDMHVHFILSVSYLFIFNLFYLVAIYIIFYPFVVYNLYKSDSILNNQIKNVEGINNKIEIKETVSLFELLKIRRFIFGALSQMFVMMSV